MKATQVLDARRNVKKQIVSYISIMVIAMVAVSAYLGIAYPAAASASGSMCALPMMSLSASILSCRRNM